MSGQDSLGILIPSCDNYSDAWSPFFELLFLYWPDPGYPVYLLSNLEEFRHPRVINIRVGPDTDWSSNLIAALDRIPESHVLVILEDYFLVEPVDTVAIRELFLHQCRSGIGYLRLYPCPGARRVTENVGGYDMGIVEKGTPYRASLQSAIWQKHLLRNLARSGESAWDFEDAGSRRSNGMEDVFSSVTADLEGKLPLKYLCTAIVGKHWTKEAVDLCARHSIPINFEKRRVEPWYRKIRRNPYYQTVWRQIRKAKEIVRSLRVTQV